LVGGSPSSLTCTAAAFERSFAVHTSAGGSGAATTVDVDDKEYEEEDEDEDGTGDGAAAVAETLIAEATEGGGREGGGVSYAVASTTVTHISL
jgi:hypothetical protein